MRRRSAHVAAIAAAAVFVTVSSVALSSPALADLLITVDKSTQRMSVERDGAELFNWPVSTGAAGYDTPSGTFTPNRMEKDHFSKEWDDAPMPNSIFFTLKGHAIHGTTHSSLGRAASHGCVRLSVKNSETLFGLVKQEGMTKTHVVLTGEVPGAADGKVATRSAPAKNATRYEQDASAGDVTGSLRPVPPAYVRPPEPRYEVQPQIQQVQPQEQYRMYRGRMVRMFRGSDGRLYYEDAPQYARPRYVEPRYAEPRYYAPRRYGYEVPPPDGYYYDGR